MAKKPLSVIVFCFLFMSLAFAGETVVNIAPYSFQNVNVDSENYGSSYGFSLSAGYRHGIWKGLSVGGDIEYSVYRYRQLEKAYNVVGVTADADWTFRFATAMYADAGLGLGFEERIIGTVSAGAFCMKIYGNFAYGFNERIAATAGLDLRMAFQKGSSDFSVVPSLGARVTL